MNYRLKLTAVIALLGMTFIQLSAAPDTKRVRNVSGRCEITRHITQEQAEQKALQDAKTNAMREAGVPEKLWSVTGLISEDEGSEFSQVLSRMTTLAVDGFITIRDVVYSEEMIDGRRYAVATIDADVRRGGEIDPTFVLDVNGINGVYGEGETMNFNVRIYGHDAYLRVFWFDETGGSVIYPSQYEPNKLFKKDFEYSFPTNPGIDYAMYKTNEDSDFESINIIAVATKRDIPFIGDKITFETLLKWIYAIPADERAAYREAVLIK